MLEHDRAVWIAYFKRFGMGGGAWIDHLWNTVSTVLCDVRYVASQGLAISHFVFNPSTWFFQCYRTTAAPVRRKGSAEAIEVCLRG